MFGFCFLAAKKTLLEILRQVREAAFFEIVDAPGFEGETCLAGLGRTVPAERVDSPEEPRRVGLEGDCVCDGLDFLAEEVLHALLGAVDVACGAETRTLDLLEQDGLVATGECLARNGGHLEVGVDFFLDPFQHPRSFKIQQGLFEGGVHGLPRGCARF